MTPSSSRRGPLDVRRDSEFNLEPIEGEAGKGVRNAAHVDLKIKDETIGLEDVFVLQAALQLSESESFKVKSVKVLLHPQGIHIRAGQVYPALKRLEKLGVIEQVSKKIERYEVEMKRKELIKATPKERAPIESILDLGNVLDEDARVDAIKEELDDLLAKYKDPNNQTLFKVTDLGREIKAMGSCEERLKQVSGEELEAFKYDIKVRTLKCFYDITACTLTRLALLDWQSQGVGVLPTQISDLIRKENSLLDEEERRNNGYPGYYRNYKKRVGGAITQMIDMGLAEHSPYTAHGEQGHRCRLTDFGKETLELDFLDNHPLEDIVGLYKKGALKSWPRG